MIFNKFVHYPWVSRDSYQIDHSGGSRLWIQDNTPWITHVSIKIAENGDEDCTMAFPLNKQECIELATLLLKFCDDMEDS